MKPTVLSASPQTNAAANAAAASFAALVSTIDYLSDADIESIRKAYRFADQAHLGQLRKNGDPYITHPIAVAIQCAEWKLDAQALMAALMHDAMEDCGISKAELVEQFGAPVAELVDGLTKLEKLEFDTREQNQAESFRKMLLAMARDVRVILIKLADRTHNMRTMGDMPRNKWERISRETLEIYAPIAHRLGLNITFRELQDLAFKHIYPWRSSILDKAVQRSRSRRKDLLSKVKSEVKLALADQGLTPRVHGREKTLYSIYKKMDDKHLTFAQVTDMYGFRIIFDDLLECYTAMGVLHQLYKPLPGKFKDYIALPKVNGYQSIHTTLIGPFGTNVEFQLRTASMDVVAESGVAAHWLYKAAEPGSDAAQRLGSQWLQSLLDIQHETKDAAEFWDHVKIDLFPDAIYVFTPKSKILSMPRGATVVDFAYAIHSNIGNRTVSANINGEQVPLSTEIKNGDVIEVITTDAPKPNPAWLSFVRTGRARSKIRHFLKTMAHDESLALGEKMLTQALRLEGIADMPPADVLAHGLWERLLRFTGNRSKDELLADIGMGKRIASMVAKKLAVLLSEQGVKADVILISQARYSPQKETISQGVVTLDGGEGGSVQFARCCHPIPGDKIVGYLGRGEGLVVHTDDCQVGKKLLYKDRERFLEVEWAEDPVRSFEVALQVTVTDGKGVLARVASTLASAGADITHVNMSEERAGHATDLRFAIAIQDKAHLNDVLRALERTPSVLRAERSRHSKERTHT
jgi:guanosine-3',5'-bis(diphosphate) 3'-pyrophosphohydrolase